MTPTIQGSSLNEQMSFVNYELTGGTEQAAGKSLAAATTANAAGSIVSSQYERPANKASEAAARGAIATTILSRSTPGIT
jgi:hypothetical protein